MTLDARMLRVLRQHVQTDRLLGADAVPVRDDDLSAAIEPETANAGAGQMMEASTGRGMTPPARPQPQEASTATSSPATGPTAGPPALPKLDRSAVSSADRAEKQRLLDELNASEVRDCRRCMLCESRTQTVFGVGDADADLMFIGEGPGQHEDEQGEPFVGKAGELLNKMINAMGITREQVYIANVVKCRPPNNRTPTPEETQTCWPYLERQIAIIQPRVIVTVGGPATKTLLGTQQGITRLRGTWHEFHPGGSGGGGLPGGGGGLLGGASAQRPIPVMPTFHPAYLLRSYTVDNRKKVWSDLQQVMELLGMRGGDGAG